jgi:hypothetical protein
MNTTIPDLWPPDFGTSAQPSPAVILRQQAYLLGQRTKNFVIGEVQSTGNPADGFSHDFTISAPLLNYRQPILFVRHKIDRYPAELVARKVKTPSQIEPPILAKSADEFIQILRTMLARQDVVELIRALLDQCQDVEE